MPPALPASQLAAKSQSIADDLKTARTLASAMKREVKGFVDRTMRFVVDADNRAFVQTLGDFVSALQGDLERLDVGSVARKANLPFVPASAQLLEVLKRVQVSVDLGPLARRVDQSIKTLVRINKLSSTLVGNNTVGTSLVTEPAISALPSENVLSLAEVLRNFGNVIAKKSYLYLVGDLVDLGKGETIDLMVNGEVTEEVVAQIGNLFPPSLAPKVRLFSKASAGSFDSAISIAELGVTCIDPTTAERSVVRKQAHLRNVAPGPKRAMLHYHFCGPRISADLRIDSGMAGDYAVGWRLDLPRITKQVTPTVDTAKAAIGEFTPYGNGFSKSLITGVKAAPLPPQPLAWLDIDGEVFAEGEVGASSQSKGVAVAAVKTTAEFGLQLAAEHEYFLPDLGGILRIRLNRETGTWIAKLSSNLLPNVLSKAAVFTGVMPPDGQSALPQSLEKMMPAAWRYWEHSGDAAREIRDAFVDLGMFNSSNVQVVAGELQFVVAKRYLFTAPKDDGLITKRQSSPEFIAAVIGEHKLFRADLGESEPDAWAKILKDAKNSSEGVLLLSATGGDPERLIKAAGGFTGDLVLDLPDCAVARADLEKTFGQPFKISQAPHRIYAASFAIAEPEAVEWVASARSVTKRIVLRDGEYCVVSEDGDRNFGCFATRDEAETRLGQIEGFKESAIKGAPQERMVKALVPEGEEEHFCLGIVLEPETIDAQNDIYSAAEVRTAAHKFMEDFRNMGFMHRKLVNQGVKILESFIAPADMTINAVKIVKGTWLIAVRILDEELWVGCKEGRLTGFSIGGSAVRVPEGSNN